MFEEEEAFWLVIVTLASIVEALIVSYFAAWLESKKDARNQASSTEQLAGLIVQNILDSEDRMKKRLSKSRKLIISKIEEAHKSVGGP